MSDIAWAAGLFEGEGCVTSHGADRSQLKLSMIDEDVVRHFHAVVGEGNVYYNAPFREGWKPQYRWQTAKQSAVHEIAAVFWPYLGERRKAQFRARGIDPTRLANYLNGVDV